MIVQFNRDWFWQSLTISSVFTALIGQTCFENSLLSSDATMEAGTGRIAKKRSE